MKAHGLARLGNDAQLRYTSNNDPVVSLSLAFSYGKKGADGKRPTQWVDASMFGKRAESLSQYLVKGSQIVAYLEDVHIETYEGKNGQGTKLAGRLTDLELISERSMQDRPQERAQDRHQEQRAARPAARPASAATRPVAAGSGFDDMDNDVPF